MYCPKCGKSDQTPETFCRQCGTFLPDLSKPVKGPISPEQHLTANIVLGAMTVVASWTLAILLWAVLGVRDGVHPLIYVTAGVLFAIGCWHVQTLIRSVMLRKQLKKLRPDREEAGVEPKALVTADFENVVPASVTEVETRDLIDR